MARVFVGVDPHKLSATIEVAGHHRKLGRRRFRTGRADYTGMLTYAKSRPGWTWAVEGTNGTGRPIPQRSAPR